MDVCSAEQPVAILRNRQIPPASNVIALPSQFCLQQRLILLNNGTVFLDSASIGFGFLTGLDNNWIINLSMCLLLLAFTSQISFFSIPIESKNRMDQHPISVFKKFRRASIDRSIINMIQSVGKHLSLQRTEFIQDSQLVPSITESKFLYPCYN